MHLTRVIKDGAMAGTRVTYPAFWTKDHPHLPTRFELGNGHDGNPLARVYQSVRDIDKAGLNTADLPHRPEGQVIIMGHPKYFNVDETNITQNDHMVGGVNRELAFQQWNDFKGLLETIAYNVTVLSPVPGLLDWIFAANFGLFIADAKNQVWFMASRMTYSTRQEETVYVIDNIANLGIPVIEVPAWVEKYEGGGDALWYQDRQALLLGNGPRTNLKAADYHVALLGVPVFSLDLPDPKHYHLDTAATQLPGSLLYVHNAFTSRGVQLLGSLFSGGKGLIATPGEGEESEAIKYLAANSPFLTDDNGQTHGIFADGVTLTQQRIESAYRDEVESGQLVFHHLPYTEPIKSGGLFVCSTLRVPVPRGLLPFVR